MLQANTFEVAKTLEPGPQNLENGGLALIDIPVASKSTALRAGLSNVAIIGNFPPRQCGLATFTRDMYLCLSRALPKARWNVIAMNDPGASYDYPSEVTHQLPQNEAAAYRALADELNHNGTEVLFVQHEFGIYGGPSGVYLVELLERLRMPVVTTLHTVLENPNDDQRRVMNDLIRLSSTLVTMARKGADILKSVYGVPDSQIEVVPHGAPTRPLRDTAEFKALLNLTGRKTLTTFGLLSPNKGIETVIKALPAIRDACPDVMYLVIGATHPHLIRHEGEKYRDGLKSMARDLGVEDNIRFINRFINDNDLIDILQASDVYVTPYLTETQITSGTLSYALALGRPIVSTPYWHAVEVLANGVGVLCPFHDSDAFGRAIIGLLTSDKARGDMSARAYQAGRPSRWSAVAQAYVARAAENVLDYEAKPVEADSDIGEAPAWGAVERMTDDCGILQHGKYRLPDRRHGYCADDNCRALSLAARWSKVAPLDERRLELAYRYAAFMSHAWNPDTGRFRNFMAYDRQWLDEGGSDDCCARSLESLIDVARSDLPRDLRAWAIELAGEILPHTPLWDSTRARAILVKALSRAFGVVGDGQVIQGMIRTLGTDLHTGFKTHSRDGHIWLEPGLAYDNARLPEGLIIAGHFLANRSMLRDGLDSLRWLMAQQTAPGDDVFMPVPTSRFKSDSAGHPLYDQQPLEVLATIDACLTAYRVSHDGHWKSEALRAFAWFGGRNTQRLALVDGDGGCCDGLTPDGVNENQGAESILSHVLGWAALKAGL